MKLKLNEFIKHRCETIEYNVRYLLTMYEGVIICFCDVLLVGNFKMLIMTYFQYYFNHSSSWHTEIGNTAISVFCC